MARLPDPQFADQWRRRLERFQKSDLTVAHFCQREDYSVASFYKWRRKLEADQQEDGADGAFVAVDLASPPACDQPMSMIQIELPNRRHRPLGCGLPATRAAELDRRNRPGLLPCACASKVCRSNAQ